MLVTDGLLLLVLLVAVGILAELTKIYARVRAISVHLGERD